MKNRDLHQLKKLGFKQILLKNINSRYQFKNLNLINIHLEKNLLQSFWVNVESLPYFQITCFQAIPTFNITNSHSKFISNFT